MTPPADPTAAERAARVHRRLSDFARRLEAGKAKPGELTVIFDKAGDARAGLVAFSRMARRAVRRKYAAAGRHGVVRWLRIYEGALLLPGSCVQSPRRDAGRRLLQGWRRIGAHATRRCCDDADLFACLGDSGSMTSWIFQCPDLRFRLHAGSGPRLAFLHGWWTEFVGRGAVPSAAAATFGADRFPLGADLRSDIIDPLPHLLLDAERLRTSRLAGLVG